MKLKHVISPMISSAEASLRALEAVWNHCDSGHGPHPLTSDFGEFPTGGCKDDEHRLLNASSTAPGRGEALLGIGYGDG